MTKPKKHSFKAETQKVLSILTHSLYTNREIFLRELLSNASDALDKLRFLQSAGDNPRDADLPLEIRIIADKDQGILRIVDTGIGMTEKEMLDNLGTIAKSGSEQFLKDHSEEKSDSPSSAADIIGRFGIGFYSVFMAASSVEVISIPAFGDGTAHAWSSEGTGNFTVRALDESEAAEYKRGTVIKATLKDDAKEFLEKYRLEDILRKHSNFLPFPIYMEDERLNTTPALWREPKFSITQEQYKEFYTYQTQDQTPPLDVLHLSVDAPVQFNALLFIPDSEQDYFGPRHDQWGLDLYMRRVLIKKASRELIPEYLAFLKGVVDTEDLPLNISRETLQENLVLRKISQTIVKQTLGHLEKMAEADSAKYARFWKLHGKYFKFAFNDFMNRDRVVPLMRFTSSAGVDASPTSLDQYLARAKEGQQEIWYVTTPSPEAAGVNPHMERFRRKGIEVLYLLEPVDEFALESLGKYKDHPFKSIEQADSKALEAFTDLDEAPAAKAMTGEEQEDFDKLVQKIKDVLGDRITDIRVSDRLSGSPAVLVSPDGMSSSMEKLFRVMQKIEDLPKKALELNPDHPFVRTLLGIFSADSDNPLVTEFINSLYDNVLLLDGYLGDPYLMADRNLKLMDKAAAWYLDLAKK